MNRTEPTKPNRFEPLFISANPNLAEAVSGLSESPFVCANPHLSGAVLGLIASGKVKTLEEAEKKVQLSQSVQTGQLELLEKLLKNSASANDTGDSGFDDCLLTQAIWRGKIESVRVLLKFGADPNPSKGCPPLLQAISQLNVEAAKLLIAAGADVNSPSVGEQPELLSACLSRNEEMIELLLLHGAKVNRQGIAYVTKKHIVKDVTPLMIAAWLGKPKIVKLLLKSGANPSIKDAEGCNALDWAKRCRSKKSRDQVSAILSAE